EDVGLRERDAPRAQGREALALDLLRHEEQLARLLEVLDVARELRVRDAGEHGGLALRQLDLLPALRAAHAEALHRDERAALGVDRLERRGLRALAEHPDHAVAAVAERAGGFARGVGDGGRA